MAVMKPPDRSPGVDGVFATQAVWRRVTRHAAEPGAFSDLCADARAR
jgi:hypothetical protein